MTEMATHFSILAWEIPWTEEPGGLESTELQRVQHNLATEHTCTTNKYYTTKCAAKKGEKKGGGGKEECNEERREGRKGSLFQRTFKTWV